MERSPFKNIMWLINLFDEEWWRSKTDANFRIGRMDTFRRFRERWTTTEKKEDEDG